MKDLYNTCYRRLIVHNGHGTLLDRALAEQKKMVGDMEEQERLEKLEELSKYQYDRYKNGWRDEKDYIEIIELLMKYGGKTYYELKGGNRFYKVENGKLVFLKVEKITIL